MKCSTNVLRNVQESCRDGRKRHSDRPGPRFRGRCGRGTHSFLCLHPLCFFLCVNYFFCCLSTKRRKWTASIQQGGPNQCITVKLRCYSDCTLLGERHREMELARWCSSEHSEARKRSHFRVKEGLLRSARREPLPLQLSRWRHSR